MACEHCEGDETYTLPDVTVTDRWVAVQFNERGPVFVLEETGQVTERFTVPADVAQLPLPTPRPVRVVHFPGDAA